MALIIPSYGYALCVLSPLVAVSAFLLNKGLGWGRADVGIVDIYIINLLLAGESSDLLFIVFENYEMLLKEQNAYGRQNPIGSRKGTKTNEDLYSYCDLNFFKATKMKGVCIRSSELSTSHMCIGIKSF